jgi:hypothetical protein
MTNYGTQDFLKAVSEGCKTTKSIRGFRFMKEDRNKWKADIIGAAAHHVFGARNLEGMLDTEPDFVSIGVLADLEIVKVFAFLAEPVQEGLVWFVSKSHKLVDWMAVISYLWIYRFFKTREECAEFAIWLYYGYNEWKENNLN